MKIAIITCDNPCQRYFVNKIDKIFGVDSLFLVRKKRKKHT
jgi:hypothetical protein